MTRENQFYPYPTTGGSCECGICRISRVLREEVLEREPLSAGVDWMLEAWAEDSTKLNHLLSELKTAWAKGEAIPASVVEAWDIAAEGTALHKDYPYG